MTDAMPSAVPGDGNAAPVEEFDAALKRLSAAKPFARPRYQPDVMRSAGQLLDSASGLRALYDRAGQFEAAGVFHGGPWADPKGLQPQLVRACLQGDAGAATLEALSELRLLATAAGRSEGGSRLDAERARRFLRDVVALNLDLVFSSAASAADTPWAGHARARRLFALIGAELSLDGLRDEVTQEVLDLAAQRPIVTSRIKKLIALASHLPPAAQGQSLPDALDVFQQCLRGPSSLCQQHALASDYRDALRAAPPDVLQREAAAFGASLRQTGLVHGHHPVLLRRLCSQALELLPLALGLDAAGTEQLQRHQDSVVQLIRATIVPTTAEAVFGLARVLQRGLFDDPALVAGLRELIELDIVPDVERALLAWGPDGGSASASAVLAAGALCVMGQPLGIGQGANPTCQAARAISLWAAHAPTQLLRMLAHAARDGSLEASFEGAIFRSEQVSDGPLDAPDTSLDPVQIVLVPHLNRIYDGMIARAGLRSVDSHKWVNPAMYGRWVPKGFASCIDPGTQVVTGYDQFLRQFFATHHPDYSDDAQLTYPNPVGLLLTDARGRYLGPHAVAIQRVARDPADELRVYFFNPNDDGRQRWAPDITPKVRGTGELPGESSLPFCQLASRIYAFHFDPYQQGDAHAVPEVLVAQVTAAARESWAPAFEWAAGQR